MTPAPPILLALELTEENAPRQGYLQRLAGGELWSAAPLGAEARPSPRPEREIVIDREWMPIHDGVGLDRGELRRVVSWCSAAGQRRLDFADGESFVVDADGAWIARVAGAGEREEGTATVERALGAPLAFALAARGVHLLHASALAGDSGVIAFTAPSGVGKSTLAAHAERLSRGAWRRIADDVLPVRLGAAEALPHLPQPKLAATAQYPAGDPLQLPLRALVELERRPESAAVEVVRLDPAASALALAGATVAARWFDRTLLAEHLTACATGADRVPVARLAYPSGVERLEAVLAALVAHLG